MPTNEDIRLLVLLKEEHGVPEQPDVQLQEEVVDAQARQDRTNLEFALSDLELCYMRRC